MEIKIESPQPTTLNITDCLYHNLTSFPRKSELYTCTVIEINGAQKDTRSHSNHMPDKTNEDVKIVRLMRTKNCSRIPNGLMEIFSKMEVLIVNDCKITKIGRNDLKGLDGLKDLIIEHTPIYYLNEDVFRDLRGLEVVMFNNTKLSTIEPNTFDSLKELKGVYLVKNPAINAVYVESMDFELSEIFDPYVIVPSINELKKIIKGCSPCDSVCSDLKKLLANEDFKDFTVTIKESCYHGIDCNEKCCNEVVKVHKFLLIARSPTLAQMIHNNPDARNLNLIDIPRYAFKKVIEYFYNGIVPTSKSDPYLKIKDLYTVADKLGLKEIRQIARNEILRQEVMDKNDTNIVNDRNDVDFRISQSGSNKEKTDNHDVMESSKNEKINEEQMTKSLDNNCSCLESDQVDKGQSLNNLKHGTTENCDHYEAKNIKSLVFMSQLGENMTEKMELISDGLDIRDDHFGADSTQSESIITDELMKNIEEQSRIQDNSTNNLDGFKNCSITDKIPNSTSDTSLNSQKSLNYTPEDLNYLNANKISIRGQQRNSTGELNNSGSDDFIQLELEDQYEIINDFYDEVCTT